MRPALVPDLAERVAVEAHVRTIGHILRIDRARDDVVEALAIQAEESDQHPNDLARDVTGAGRVVSERDVNVVPHPDIRVASRSYRLPRRRGRIEPGWQANERQRLMSAQSRLDTRKIVRPVVPIRHEPGKC